MFKFLKNFQTLIQSGCTIWHSHHQCMWVPVAPHSCQHLVLSVFIILVILVSMWWHFIAILTCILLMTSDIEHIFMCMLAVYTFFFLKCLFPILFVRLSFYDWFLRVLYIYIGKKFFVRCVFQIFFPRLLAFSFQWCLLISSFEFW